MDQLTVHDFSVLHQAEYHSSSINVLIGPQASGKSLLMRLNYFFDTIPVFLLQCLQERSTFEEFKIQNRERFLRFFPFTAWGNDRFSISAVNKLGQFRVTLHTKSREDVIIYYPKGLEDQYSQVRGEIVKTSKVFSFNNERIQITYEGPTGLTPWNSSSVYIPAGRSFFSVLQTSAFRFLADGESLDPLIVDFGRIYENILQRDMYLNNFNQRSRSLAKLIGGKIERKNNRVQLVSSDGRRIPISTISSGQQEIMPLLLTMEYYANRTRRVQSPSLESYNFYIEEPEAHLFPEAQKKIIEVIVSLFNNILRYSPNSKLHIATHSPYVLTAMNNLILAGQEFNKCDEMRKEKIQSLLYPNSIIENSNINAYQIDEHEHGLISIIDDDTGLINAEYIDMISHEIANTFEEILNVR